MKMLCATLLLIAAVFFGWQRYAEYKQRQDQKARELMDGYDRCAAGADAALAQGDNSEHSKEVWNKARQGCRDFYFSHKF
jgi:hypothetical protein